jgi:hypothetical protein
MKLHNMNKNATYISCPMTAALIMKIEWEKEPYLPFYSGSKLE